MLLKSHVNHFFCNCLSLFLLLLYLHLQCYAIHNSIQSSSTIHKSHISNNTKSDTNGQETARSMRNWPSFTTIPNANNKNLNFLASMVVNNVENDQNRNDRNDTNKVNILFIILLRSPLHSNFCDFVTLFLLPLHLHLTCNSIHNRNNKNK